ncbi:MAG: CpaF family protein [Alphaproteobacteria bacterium]|nr:CpaF family protein [Alphaproteobacteria bacterium]
MSSFHNSLNIDAVEVYSVQSLKLPPALHSFRDKAFEEIIEAIDIGAARKLSRVDLLAEVERFLTQLTNKNSVQINYKEHQHIANDIVNDMIGLGPLEALVHDETVTDIMVNSPTSVFVERKGKLVPTDLTFRSDKHVMQIAQRIANQVGRRVDESSPMVDARLKDGSRVNVIIPPLALEGVSISIRKFSKTSISLEKMADQGNISEQMLQFLRIASRCRLNIIVAGGTGAGKTTLLNALSQLIDPAERIVTIEDSAELRLQQPHVVRLESRPSNIEGEGEVAIRDLLKNSLRMRPDRIVVGECRGAEAFDMLQAMNTGHDGSMSTLHANTAEDALSRMENMVLMAGFGLPNEVVRSYISDAVDLIVHISRMRDGIRRVGQIMEVRGINENGHIDARNIFSFGYEGMDANGRIIGNFNVTDEEPYCMEKVRYFNLEKEMKTALGMPI